MPALTIPGLSPVNNWTTLVLKYANVNAVQNLIGPWRPPQWAQGVSAQLYSLTVVKINRQTTNVQSTLVEDAQVTPGTTNQRQTAESTTYFFDAIIRAEHRQDLAHTEHPIQSGASIADHAYLRPARVILEIGISDAMGSFIAGQFSAFNSRSIAAFQTLLDIQALRIPLTLTTRLNQYSNLLIESIGAVEDARTRFAGRFQVVFAQIRTANLATRTVSARPDQTDTTNEGTKQPVTPPATVSTAPGVAHFPGTANITGGGVLPELGKNW